MKCNCKCCEREALLDGVCAKCFLLDHAQTGESVKVWIEPKSGDGNDEDTASASAHLSAAATLS